MKRDAAKTRAYGRRRHAELKERVFEALGRVCVRCGFSDPRALQIDHIHGGGHRLRLASRTRSMVSHMAAILRHPDVRAEFQILCANCNWIKAHENSNERPGPRPRKGIIAAE